MDTVDNPVSIAEAAFLLKYPREKDFFDTVWHLLEQGRVPGETGGEGSQTPFELGVLGSPDAVAVEMAREVAMFFELLADKFPVVRDELVARLDAVCAKYGKAPTYLSELRRRVSSAMETQAQFVVYRSTSTGTAVERAEYTARTLTNHALGGLDRYTIVVRKGNVRVRFSKQPQTLVLAPLPYRLLVVLLMHKDEPVDTPCLCCAVYEIATPMSFDVKTDVEERLKYVVNDLRARMKPLGTAFAIPRKPPNGGYRCIGDFTFCLVLTKREAEKICTGLELGRQ